MAVPTFTPAYDYFLEFVVEKTTPQEILAFELPLAVRQRAIDLLTPDEAAELQQMRQVELLMMALKARAMDPLDRP